MADQADDPILDALPPATDYITYLTILEYQLTKERLPSLETVLEDETLTENIGWDLIHLLLPLLPEAKNCLKLIAHRGNPREVVIRLSEELSKLASGDDEETENSSDGVDNDTPSASEERPVEQIIESLAQLHADDLEAKEAALSTAEREHLVVKNEPQVRATATDDVEVPLLEDQFSCLIAMLAVCQRRIKTKYPSRFLATSLPAVLAAYRRVISPLTTENMIKFIAAISGRQRPSLPPRNSSITIPRAQDEAPLPDPEATVETLRSSEDEDKLVLRLLQATLLECFEDYVLDAAKDEGDPGMGWDVRMREVMQPEKVVPGRKTETARFEVEKKLLGRDTTVKSFFELSRDLGIQIDELLDNISKPRDQLPSPDSEAPESPSEYPSNASDVPFPSNGSIYLVAACVSRYHLSHTATGTRSLPVSWSTFPQHAALLKRFITSETDISDCPAPTVDALLAFGLDINPPPFGLFGKFPSDAEVKSYIWTLSILSATNSNPSHRYSAHVQAARALHAHEDAALRLELIHNMLFDPPLPKLKATAVGWLKDEIHAASDESAPYASERTEPEQADSRAVFLSPSLLNRVEPDLFPEVPTEYVIENEPDAMAVFLSSITLHLTVLNLYYMLLSSSILREQLDIVHFHERKEITSRYLQNLKKATNTVEKMTAQSNSENGAGFEIDVHDKMELMLLGDMIDTVEGSFEKLSGGPARKLVADAI